MPPPPPPLPEIEENEFDVPNTGFGGVKLDNEDGANGWCMGGGELLPLTRIDW